MSLAVTSEPEFDTDTATLTTRRRPSHFACGRDAQSITTATARANLRGDYEWLRGGGHSLESIAQRLDYSPDTLERYLSTLGYTNLHHEGRP